MMKVLAKVSFASLELAMTENECRDVEESVAAPLLAEGYLEKVVEKQPKRESVKKK